MKSVIEKDGLVEASFSTNHGFRTMVEMAKEFAQSDVIPLEYQGKPANVLIALDFAKRVDMSPFMVMQNLDLIHGRPSWRAKFLLALLNNSGKYGNVEFVFGDNGEKTTEYTVSWYEGKDRKTSKKSVTYRDITCYAKVDVATPQRVFSEVKGPIVSMEMAIKEGWYGKNGSKWQTMPELMLRYRSVSFLVNTTCPEVALGLPTAEEVEDMTIAVEEVPEPVITVVNPSDIEKVEDVDDSFIEGVVCDDEEVSEPEPVEVEEDETQCRMKLVNAIKPVITKEIRQSLQERYGASMLIKLNVEQLKEVAKELNLEV